MVRTCSSKACNHATSTHVNAVDCCKEHCGTTHCSTRLDHASIANCTLVLHVADHGADASAITSDGKGMWALAAEAGVDRVASLLARGVALPEGGVEHLLQLLQAEGMKDTQVIALASGCCISNRKQAMLHV
jgi:hypothetical protein